MTTTAQPSSLAARLMIGGRVFGQREVDDQAHIAEVQEAMVAARERFGHALCLCRRQPLKLQVRLRESKFHLAVWPNEGPLHDSECAFFRDDLWSNPNITPRTPDQVRAQSQATHDSPLAAGRSPTANSTPGPLSTLRPRTPSARVNGQAEAIAPATPATERRSLALAIPGQRANSEGADRRLNLKNLAMGLWEEADLCRWHPSWTRDWGRARYQLMRVAHTLEVNGVAMEELLFVPRRFRESAREQLNADWRVFLASLSMGGRDATRPMRLLVAPVRSFSVAANQLPVIHLRHLRHPVSLSNAAFDFLRNNCSTALRHLQANDDEARINKAIEGNAAIPFGKSNPGVMGFFLAEENLRGGVFARATWLMNVHPRSFIPANNPNSVLLVDALLDNGHAFQRILTDVEPVKRVAPDWLVRYVVGPNGQTVARAALDVLERGSSREYLQTRHAMAASLAAKGVPTWTWVPGGSCWAERRVPALPPRDEQATDEVQRRLQEISTCADADYQFGPSPRFST
jgi:hypothetical protein